MLTLLIHGVHLGSEKKGARSVLRVGGCFLELVRYVGLKGNQKSLKRPIPLAPGSQPLLFRTDLGLWTWLKSTLPAWVMGNSCWCPWVVAGTTGFAAFHPEHSGQQLTIESKSTFGPICFRF